jgi:hypothetical protein
MATTWLIDKNLAQSSLASGYTAGATTITLATGEGARFDSPTGSQGIMLAFNDPPDFFVRCTGRSSDTLTIDATGAEGSTVANESVGCKITQVITGGVLADLLVAAARPQVFSADLGTAGTNARVMATVYQNTQVYPMWVKIRCTSSSGGTVRGYIGATSSPAEQTDGNTLANSGFDGSMTLLVPPSWYYKATVDGGAGAAFAWTESY